MIITRHAQARIRQRAIPTWVIELLQDYGEISYHRGRVIFQFTRKSRRTIRRDLERPKLRALDKYFNTYLVMQDNQLITAAYQDRHLKRDRR